MMKDPSQALDAMVREELNIHPAELAPLKDGVVTGVATAIGAFIPIVPFLVMAHDNAVWVSLAVSMLAHFGDRGRAEPVHRTQPVGERPRHVRGWFRRCGRRIRDWRGDYAVLLKSPPAKSSHESEPRTMTSFF